MAARPILCTRYFADFENWIIWSYWLGAIKPQIEKLEIG